MVKVFKLEVGNPLRKLVLLKLADQANDKGECWPSYQYIADQCEVSRSTAKNHIRELEKMGWLTRVSRRDGELNQSNLYLIKLPKNTPKKRVKKVGQQLPEVGQELPEGGNSCPRVGQELPEGRSTDDLGGGAGADPRTSHSFEPVIEPVIEPLAEAATATTAQAVDSVRNDDPVQPRVEIPADMPGPKDPKAKTFKTWANYAITYRRRYGVWPVWNARVAGQLGNLIDRIGHDAAPKVAAYYLSIADQRYITEQHSVGMLLSRCEALHTQWQTGTRVNGTTARQQERTAANFEAAQTVIKKIMTDEQPVGSQQAEGSIYDNPFWK